MLVPSLFYGDGATVRLLLERGADPNYVSYKGWDALGPAELHRHDAVSALLRAYGAGQQRPSDEDD